MAIAAVALIACSADRGEIRNPHPIALRRPARAPLSEMALLGREIFNDTALSASGRVSCATCHRSDQAYASVRDGMRAVPSLRYAFRAPPFTIGPDLSDVDEPDTSATTDSTARGGLFWDGRANTLQDQAMGPLFNPEEMGNRDVPSVAAKLRSAEYAPRFGRLFGRGVFAEPARLVDEAMFAVARYQIEDPSFHPYDSKYDRFLEGRATLTETEWRGLEAFVDPERGNCAACHQNAPRGDGLPPAFTDYEYVALGVPRDTMHAVKQDLGACGPLRTDLLGRATYCATFRTPTLRNSATRAAFFHNGVYHTLQQVLAFYNFRDVRPEWIYPSRSGAIAKFDDIPAQFRRNVDTIDPPLNRKRGQQPAMTNEEMRDIIAFLETLTDSDLSRVRTRK